MDAQQWREIKRVLAEALDLDGDERREFLEVQCPREDPLRADVDALIDADERARSFLADPGAAIPLPQLPRTTVDQQVAGYRILGKLGSGGMGTVYKAYDEKMKRTVALKVLASHLALSRSAGLRFEQEAWIAGRLDHPNLVKVYDRGTWEGISYFSMELVHGGSLAEVIRNLKRTGRDEQWNLEFGSRDYFRWAITRLIGAARGVEYAHRKGVVHRDIKPLNLLLGRDPDVLKVADFGLAMDAGVARMTLDGQVMGTPSYMAPEQLLGRADEMGGATDVYGLGVTLFELLTLELPYKGESQEHYVTAVLTQEVRRTRKLNRRVARDLETVVHKALEKEPGERYATAAEFADDLERVLHLRPILARPLSRLQRSLKWIRRQPMHATLLAVLIVGIPALALLASRSYQSREFTRESQIEAWRQEATWLAREGRDGEALDRTSAGLRLDPDDVGALRIRALSSMRLALNTPDPADATVLQEQSLQDASRILALKPDVVWPHRLQTLLLSRFGREPQATEATTPGAPQASGNMSNDELLRHARWSLDAGDPEETIARVTELLARGEHKPEAYILRAVAYEARGRRQQALVDYRVAAGLRPEDTFIRRAVGRLYTKTQRYDQAEAIFWQLLASAPEDVEARDALSMNHLQRGREALGRGDAETAVTEFEKAEGHARESLQRDPSRPWPHHHLGASLVERSRAVPVAAPALVDEAIEHYEMARELAATSSDAAHLDLRSSASAALCEALIQQRQLGRASAACREVVESGSDLLEQPGFQELLRRLEDVAGTVDKQEAE